MEAGLAFNEITSPDPPTRFLLVRDGNAKFTGEGFEDIHLNEDGAYRVIADFKRQGNAIPIDYHHASLQVEQTKQGSAPAAGWINDLEYVPGEGLYAKQVEWTDKAAAQLQDREFKYWSPVVFRDEDESVYHLHSVALTNRPRTREMTEILRAAHLAANSNERSSLMATPKKKAMWTGSKVVAAQEDDMAVEQAGAAPMDPAQVAQIKLMQVLELSDDATLVDVLNAAIDKLGGEPTDAGEGEGGEEAAEAHRAIAAALGTDATDPKVIAAEIDTLKAQASQADALSKRLKVVEASILDKEKKDRETVAAALVDEQVEAGRLLPDDEAAMKAAGALAMSDPDGFKAIYASMPAIVEPGTVQATKPKKKDERSKVIAAASLEYDQNHVYASQQCSKESWTNVDLRNAGLPTLTEEEVKALA